MEKTIDTQFGELKYNESFFTGKIDIYLNGIHAIKKRRKVFQIESDEDPNDITSIYIYGNFLFGVKVIINGKIYTIYEKPRWYEYLIALLFIAVTIIWGSIPALVKIIPIVGGAIGGAIAGFFNALGFALARKTNKILKKLISLIGFGLLSFITCFAIAICILNIVFNNVGNVEVENNDLKVRNVAEKETYNVYVGDVFTPFYNGVNELYNFDTSDWNVVSVDDAGYINAKKLGNAKIYVFDGSICYAYVVINVIEKPIINYNYDEKLYNEFTNRIDDYVINDSFSLEVDYNINNFSELYSVKIGNEPFYFESIKRVNSNITRECIKKEEDGYYKFDIYEDIKYIKKTLLDDSNFDLSEYNALNFSNVDELKNLNFDVTEMEKVNDNEYIIKFYSTDIIKFLLGFDNEEILELLSVGKDSIVVCTITFSNDSILVFFSTNYHFVYQGYLLEFPLNVNFSYIYNRVEISDFSTYDFPGPSSIDEAKEPVKFDRIYLEKNTKRCVYTYLETGSYLINTRDDSLSDLKINIYDSEKNEVNLFEFNSNSYLDKIIYIANPDYYYFCFEYDNKEGSLFFSKLEINDSNNEFKKTNNGNIEKKYDFDKYVFEASSDNIAISFTNTGRNNIFVYLDGFYYDNYSSINMYNHIARINNLQTLWLHPLKAKSILYIVSNLEAKYDDEYIYDYSFEIEIIENNNGTDYDNLDVLKEEYDKNYFLGYDYKPIKLKLNALKHGLYKIYSKNEDLEYSIKFKIEGYNEYKDYYILNEGNYIVEVTYDPNIFKNSYLKYVFIEDYEKNIDIELQTIENKNDISSKKYYFNNIKTESGLDVKYHFFLEEDTIIVLNPNHTIIYDENNKPVTFINEYYSKLYFKLSTGSYYVRFYSINDSFLLAKISFDCQAFSEDIDNQIMFDYQYEYGYNYEFSNNDICYYTLFFNEDFVIKIDSNISTLFIYDENLEKVIFSSVDKIKIIKLEGNKKYYFLVPCKYYDGYLIIRKIT